MSTTTHEMNQQFDEWWLKEGQFIAKDTIQRKLREKYTQSIDDVVTDTYIAVRKKYPGGNIKNVSGYVTKTAKNMAVEFLRKEKKAKQAPKEIHKNTTKTDAQIAHPPYNAANFLKITEDFIKHLQKQPERTKELFKAHGDFGFLLWYMNKIQKIPLKIPSSLFDLAQSTCSDRIKTFESTQLIRVMSLWAYDSMLGYLQTMSRQYDNIPDEYDESPHSIAAFLSTSEGHELLCYLKGKQNTSKKTTKKRDKFAQTSGSMLWLAHYTEPYASIDELHKQTTLPQTVILDLIEEAYPVILREFLVYHQKQKQQAKS